VGTAHIAHLAARRSAKVTLLVTRGRIDDSRTAAAWAVGLVAGYLRRGPDESSTQQAP
jgi:hypothetical protein